MISETADHFVRVARLDQCPIDSGMYVELPDREIALFRMSNPPAVYAIDNACPHASGNLAAGRVIDGVVRCPWHGWAFRLCDGTSAQGSVACVRSYPVEIRGRDVYVNLSPRESA